MSAYCHELLYEQYVSYHLLQDISREKEFTKFGQRLLIILTTRPAVSLLLILEWMFYIRLQPDGGWLMLSWEEESTSSPLDQVLCMMVAAARLGRLTRSWESLGVQNDTPQLVKTDGSVCRAAHGLSALSAFCKSPANCFVKIQIRCLPKLFCRAKFGCIGWC